MLTEEELCRDLRVRWEAGLVDVAPSGELLAQVRTRHSRARARRSIVVVMAVAGIAAATVIAVLSGTALHQHDTLRVPPATTPSGSTAEPPQLDPPLSPGDSKAIADGVVTFGPPPSYFVIYHAPGDVGTPSDRLLHVRLPHPAPGFPVRLQRDRVDNATTLLSERFPVPESAWVATFSLGTRPEHTERDSSGASLAWATGPTAQITVIDAAVPVHPDPDKRIISDPVVATTDIDGHMAFVTRGSGSHLGLPMGAVAVFFTTSHSTIMIVSDNLDSDLALARALTGV